MRVEQETWTVTDLVDNQPTIQIAPAWQRGPAWTTPRQVLLIDSILRGMDIPKIYLRERKQPSAYAYDAVDGQQRLRSIWTFRTDNFPLTHSEVLDEIDGVDVNGLNFSQLPKKLRDHFDGFSISVAKIVEADQLEISMLFARLQQGVPLNPAELRNAMLGPIRNEVETIALSHPFFARSRISEARYRRQDFVAHVCALATHGSDRDLKAPNLKQLYREFLPQDTDQVMRIAAEVGKALTILDEVNEYLGFSVRHKWIFVDLCWLIIQRMRQRIKTKPADLATQFKAFDAFRRHYTHAPEDALDSTELKKRLGKHLYQYLTAFKLQAGTKSSVALRSAALDAFCAG